MRFVGKVESLDELHRSAAAAVVPTRYGAGVKLKIVHALATATPVVATSVGAEGLALKWRRHVSIADSADRFADELAVLLTDADEWDQRHQAMRETAAEHTSDAAAAWARVLGSTVEEPKGPS